MIVILNIYVLPSLLFLSPSVVVLGHVKRSLEANSLLRERSVSLAAFLANPLSYYRPHP